MNKRFFAILIFALTGHINGMEPGKPFNNVEHLLASSTAYEYLKPVGTHPNINNIITTHLEIEAEGLRIIAEELGQEFANSVKNPIKA